MSRIDQALKRAADGGAPGGAGLSEPLNLAEGVTLSRFPMEKRHDVAISEEVSSSPGVIAAPRFGLAGHLAPIPEEFAGKLILGNTESVAVEQYRRLAGVLHEAQIMHGTRTVMVSSAVPREGKTLTVTNLALTLSESYGRRVLLIDADLRRPSIHEVLRLPNTRGLSEGLQSGDGKFPLLEVSARLSVLPAGRPQSNPMARLTSERMGTLLKESAASFDWVLLDAPPVGIMPDANLLVRLTDGVIFVIASDSTPYTLVERAVTEIGRDNILGTVLNRVDRSSIRATGYYDGYEYYGSGIRP